uniref:Uncharacterized protein n=1 Tax=Siphoviridae sp. ct43U4 TaxID=2826285 RepID=A0A8S5N0P4_9CAUD|nr:MAG TPA: hypothetical protein [Siphoviridae sp. ct43U4]
MLFAHKARKLGKLDIRTLNIQRSNYTTSC